MEVYWRVIFCICRQLYMLTVNRLVNSGGFEYIGLIGCFYSEGTGTTYMIFSDMHLRMYCKNQKMIFRVLNCMGL